MADIDRGITPPVAAGFSDKMNVHTLKAVSIALLAAAFFSMTFVLNRTIVVQGGSWGWAVSLRYTITAVLLFAVLSAREGFGDLPTELSRHWPIWIISSLIGFGLFGVCLTWSASAGPSWLIAGGFQCTVVAGPCLSVFLYKDERRHVPLPIVAAGFLIIAGIFALEYDRSLTITGVSLFLPLLAVLTAAAAYPLGNRLLLLHLDKCQCRLSATQRVFGMTLCSLVLYVPLSAVFWRLVGLPDGRMTALAASVALSSGTIATVLFFGATEMVRRDRLGLAAVEAMQAGELLFATAIGSLMFGEPWPSGVAAIGVAVIIAGIVVVSLLGSLRS